MAYVATDTFDAESDGTLSGKSGGSGWAGAWGGGANNGNIKVQGSVVYGGAKAIIFDNVPDGGSVNREMSVAVSSGNFQFAVRRNNATGEVHVVGEGSTGEQRWHVRFKKASSGQVIRLNEGSGNINLGGYNTGQWYLVEVEMANTNSYRVRLDGGSWSSSSAANDAAGTVTRIMIRTDQAAVTDSYMDDFGPGAGQAVDVTVNSSVLAATFSIPAATVTAVQNISVASSVLAATFATQAPAITGGATVSPSALAATFSIPAPDVQTPDAMVMPSVLAATFSIPAPTVTAIENVSVASSVLSATFSIPASTAIVAVTASPSPLSLTFTIPASTVTAEESVSVSPSALAMTFTIPSYTVTAIANVTASPSVLALTFSVPAFTISTVANPTITPSPLLLTLTIPAYTVTGDFWQEKFATQSTSWSNKY